MTPIYQTKILEYSRTLTFSKQRLTTGYFLRPRLQPKETLMPTSETVPISEEMSNIAKTDGKITIEGIEYEFIKNIDEFINQRLIRTVVLKKLTNTSYHLTQTDAETLSEQIKDHIIEVEHNAYSAGVRSKELSRDDKFLTENDRLRDRNTALHKRNTKITYISAVACTILSVLSLYLVNTIISMGGF